MIIYPHLLKFDKNVKLNLLWGTILERVSIGDNPFGTKIIDDKLVYKKSELYIPNCHSNDIIKFFTDVVGLQLKFIHFESWKAIKKKCIKDNLIQDFVYRFQKENNLNSHKTNYLQSMIHLYITLKKIDVSDIILETIPHTHIKAINGLLYDKQKDDFILKSSKNSSQSGKLCNTSQQQQIDEDDDDD